MARAALPTDASEFETAGPPLVASVDNQDLTARPKACPLEKARCDKYRVLNNF
jgi:hypothetical protein